ncbi:eukaryotic translation initiation factor 4E-binding protein 3-like isoform X1 [Hemiscyllium ocellatum]|uniref:eukaryotic translation initiation factor 4E-binding protein 3-like isoform X1 n=2 Tax=Hemiscyllium ocellatum TaxID=170820 RepID=UPI00296617A6|nr:eukaryotic translation initiation factor 4E-binding protein 3-like isoform X1 [Hemiscyllium ocellatum]
MLPLVLKGKRTQKKVAMSTNCRASKSCPIPTKVLVKDLSQLPDLYSTTPGGTLFSTTPGGTRIIYGRKFLMECRNSPLARTPPSYLPQIPGVTMPQHSTLAKVEELQELETETEKETPADDAQFEMDI